MKLRNWQQKIWNILWDNGDQERKACFEMEHKVLRGLEARKSEDSWLRGNASPRPKFYLNTPHDHSLLDREKN